MLAKSPHFLTSRFISTFLPFIALVLLSIILIALALWIKDPFWQSIFSNMAATSLYALMALFTYDVVKRFSDKEKNRELREYAESEVDPQIMAILLNISKLVYSRTENPRASSSIRELERLKKDSLLTRLTDKEFLGFEIFRNSAETTKNVRSLIENSFIRPLLEDELVLLLLKLANRLERLSSFLSEVNNLTKLNKSVKDEYVVFGSNEISSYNAHFPNRRLLVKKIPKRDGMGVVEDFADFSPNIDITDLLSYYKIKEKCVDGASEMVYEVITLLKQWIGKR